MCPVKYFETPKVYCSGLTIPTTSSYLMEENLAESGVDIGNSDVNVDEDIPSDNEIETIQDNDKKESVENDDNKNLNMDLENNSVSN